MREIIVDTSDTRKTLKISGPMSALRELESTTDTYATWKGRYLRLPASRMAFEGLIKVWQENWKQKSQLLLRVSD